MNKMATTPVRNTIPAVDPQRLAWGMLLLAFAAFCVICVVVGIGVNFFLFQSTIPMDSILVVGRGSIGVREANSDRYAFVPDRALLSFSSEVNTAPQSQANITFIDFQSGEHPVAYITVNSSSSLQVRSASRPRFEWSTSAYLIDLQQVAGDFDLFIPDDVGRNITISLTTVQGTLINLYESGQYIVDASDTAVRVVNRAGSASLIPPDRQSGRAIPVNFQGVLQTGGDIEVRPGFTDLLVNGNFRELNPNAGGGDSPQELLRGWVCGSDPNDNPRGSYRSQMVGGLMTLRIERYQDATTHGRTSCVQIFGQPGLEVGQNDYDFLALRARFFINFQSLHGCGIDGSECPLMLRMDYVNERGEPHIWYHGFYALNDPQLGYPLRCDSCSQEHEFINARSWYTYQSDDFLTLFPDGQKPATILSIMLYASGHQYDVHVNELALLARQAVSTEVES